MKGDDDEMRDLNNWSSSRTAWRWIMGMGWDDQMRGLETIGQGHIQPGDG